MEKRYTPGERVAQIFSLLAAALLTLPPALIVLVQSVQESNPMRGLWGSPFVGLENYVRLFSTGDFPRAVVNSLLLSLWNVAAAVVVGFLLGRPVAGMRPGRLRALCTGLLLLPAFLPGVLYQLLLGLLGGMPFYLALSCQLLVAPCRAVGFAAFAAAACGAVAQSRGTGVSVGAWQGVALASVCALACPLSPESALPINAMPTLDNWIYQTSFVTMNYSTGSAAWVVRTLVQLPLAILWALLLWLWLRRVPAPRPRKAAGIGGMWVVALPLCLVLVLSAAEMLVAFSTGVGLDPSLPGALLCGLVQMGLALLPGVALLLLFTTGLRRSLPCMLLVCLIIAAFSPNQPGAYTLSHMLGLVNTPFPAALSQAILPLPWLLSAYLSRQGRGFRATLPCLLLFGSLCAAQAWGSTAGQLYLARKDLFGPGLVLLLGWMQGTGAGVAALLTLLPALLLGVVGALLYMLASRPTVEQR